MKTLLVVALVLVPCFARADSDTNAPASAPALSPEQAAVAGLTPAQQKLGEQFLAAEEKQKKAIEDNKSLTPQQKQIAISNVQHDTLVEIEELKLSGPTPAKH